MEPFDFKAHRRDAIESYRSVRSSYRGMAECVKSILQVAIPSSSPIHTIEARAKTTESFGDKAVKPSDSGSDLPRYPNPLSQITDMAGVRVITYFPKTLDDVDKCIKEQFDVIEIANKSEELIESDKFGYQSIHYIVKLKSDRLVLPEYAQYGKMVAEIQLRTILQHAWAEMEHDIQYKTASAIPGSIRRRFMSLAGMIEIADREFQAIQDADQELRSEIKESIQKDLSEYIDLQNYVSELEEEVRELRDNANTSEYLPGSARAFLDKGYYKRAISAYSKVIDLHPTVHTNFIGRARAKALAGDTAGALEDLNQAESLHPYDPTIDKLRGQIYDGSPLKAPHSSSAYGKVDMGNQALAAGDGELALQHYTSAQEEGFNYIYSVFNRSMAYCMKGDYADAIQTTDSINPSFGSFMIVNVWALRSICYALQGEPFGQLAMELGQLSELKDYSFSRSPLRYLKQGLSSKNLLDPAGEIFDIISRDSNSQPAV